MEKLNSDSKQVKNEENSSYQVDKSQIYIVNK